MRGELHSMRLFSITADNSVSPHANRQCRSSTLTRMRSSIHLLYLRQNVAPRDLQRTSWVLRRQIDKAHSCCGREKARVRRQFCGELEQMEVTADMVQIPHGLGKFLDEEVASVVVSLHADEGHVVYLRLSLP